MRLIEIGFFCRIYYFRNHLLGKRDFFPAVDDVEDFVSKTFFCPLYIGRGHIDLILVIEPRITQTCVE